jgi:hypothetical protein
MCGQGTRGQCFRFYFGRSDKLSDSKKTFQTQWPQASANFSYDSRYDHHPHHPLRRPISKSHAESRTLRLARAWARLESCEQRAPVHPPPRGSKNHME